MASGDRAITMTLTRFLSLPEAGEEAPPWLPLKGTVGRARGDAKIRANETPSTSKLLQRGKDAGVGSSAESSDAVERAAAAAGVDPLLFSLRLRPSACLRSFEEFCFLKSGDSATSVHRSRRRSPVASPRNISPDFATLPVSFGQPDRAFTRPPLELGLNPRKMSQPSSSTWLADDDDDPNKATAPRRVVCRQGVPFLIAF